MWLGIKNKKNDLSTRLRHVTDQLWLGSSVLRVRPQCARHPGYVPVRPCAFFYPDGQCRGRALAASSKGTVSSVLSWFIADFGQIQISQADRVSQGSAKVECSSHSVREVWF